MGDDEKTCPRCAETVKAAAKVCRYCGQDLSAMAWLRPGGPKSTSGSYVSGCLGLIVVLAIIGSLVERFDKGVPPEPVVAVMDPKPCNKLLAQGRKARLIREAPVANRINVDERLWDAMPATSKRGIMLALRCSLLDGRPDTDALGAYVVAYGWRSGKRLALAGQFGVSLE